MSRIIDELGGLRAAAQVAMVSEQTLMRWVQTSISPESARTVELTYLNAWVGYPAPLSLLDRLSEQIVGPSCSYISLLSRQRGMRVALKYLVPGEVLPLDVFGVSRGVLIEAAFRARVPRTTLVRVLDLPILSRRLFALDGLCHASSRGTWIESLLSIDVDSGGIKTPPRALLCLVEALL